MKIVNLYALNRHDTKRIYVAEFENGELKTITFTYDNNGCAKDIIVHRKLEQFGYSRADLVAIADYEHMLCNYQATIDAYNKTVYDN